MKVFLLLLIALGFAHKIADDDIESLFEMTPEEEKVIKERVIIPATEEDIVVDKPKEPTYKYYDDTPHFKSASEKYIYYGLKYKIEIMLLSVVIMFVFNFFLG